MPVCTECFVKRPLDDFSDAQLCGGRGRCLACSNPRLWAKRAAAGLDHRPLSELGRSRPAAMETESRRDKGPSSVGSFECKACRRRLPLSQFSARQLAGKGKCAACAKQSVAANLAQQAGQARKRGRDEQEDAWWETQPVQSVDPEEERYIEELLRGVEEARRAKSRDAAASGPATGPVSATNRGHVLLKKLGWAPGTGLGAQEQGGLQPAAQELPAQQDKRGLGTSHAAAAAMEPPDNSPSSLQPVEFVSPTAVTSHVPSATGERTRFED